MSRSNWSEWRRPEKASLSDLYPIFGCQPFGANTQCADIHHGPIPDGDPAFCAVCFQSGLDDHADLKITATDRIAAKNWEPVGGKDAWGHATEATAYDGGRPEGKAVPTRKKRRAEAYGERSVRAEPMDPDRLSRAIDRRAATVIA
jgi:hypothetical protein